MNADQVQEFLKMAEDQNFRARFEAATSTVRSEILKQAGLSISVAEAEAVLKGERELSEQDLDQVAGGDAGIIRYPPPPPPPGG